jgi:vacuolar-type H+-ATPase subunit I/STV1
LSVLTKVFVVLLVVLSIVLTASMVVFVNRVENFKKNYTDATTQLQTERSRADAAAAEATSAREIGQRNLTAAQTAIESLKQQVNSRDQEVTKRDTEVARLTSEMAQKAADVARLTEALKASEDQKGKQQEMLADLRTSNDKYVKQFSDQSARVSELTNQLEATERLRRDLAEQLAQAQTDLDRTNKLLSEHGIRGTETPGPTAGVPAINGVVRDTRDIGGVPYATISVGSADGVTKGMEFKVIDRSKGEFVAILTVDSVEPNEATGRLTGPHPKGVRQQMEVRTQL